MIPKLESLRDRARMRERLTTLLLAAAARRDWALRALGVPISRTSGWSGSFDRPAALERAPVRLSGWLFDRASRVDRLQVEVGSRVLGPARLGLPRAAVALGHAHPEAAVSGFEIWSDLADLPCDASRLDLVARARLANGEEVVMREPGVPVLDRREPSAGFELEPAPAPARRGRRPLRIAAFAHDLGVGGAQLCLLELIAGLRERGAATATIAAPGDGPLRARFEAVGAPVERIAAYPFRGIDDYRAARDGFAEWLAGVDADLVLVNSTGAFLGVDAARRAGLPAVWAIHEGLEPETFWSVAFGSGLDPRVRDRGRALLRAAEAVVFQCEASRRLYAANLRPGAGISLPYGIATIGAAADRAAAKCRLGFGAEPLVVCVGTIEARKAQLPLARAFARVAAVRPSTRIAFVGARPGPHASTLGEYLRALGLARSAGIWPLTPDPTPWFRAADLVVCASDVESMPRVLVEAMTAGAIVVATRVGGIPETIHDGVHGFLCEPGDVASLAAAIEAALALDAESRDALAARARQRAAERHGRERYLDGYETILAAVSAGRAAPTLGYRPSSAE